MDRCIAGRRIQDLNNGQCCCLLTPPPTNNKQQQEKPTYFLNGVTSLQQQLHDLKVVMLSGQVERRHIRGELRLHFRLEKAVCVTETLPLPAGLQVSWVREDEFRYRGILLADRLQHGLLDVFAVATVQQYLYELKGMQEKIHVINTIQ